MPKTSLSVLSCRFCLVKCKNSDHNFSPEEINVYKILTGVSVVTSNILCLKICKSCYLFFKRVQRFRERAVEVEERLELAINALENFDPIKTLSTQTKEEKKEICNLDFVLIKQEFANDTSSLLNPIEKDDFDEDPRSDHDVLDPEVEVKLELVSEDINTLKIEESLKLRRSKRDLIKTKSQVQQVSVQKRSRPAVFPSGKEIDSHASLPANQPPKRKCPKRPSLREIRARELKAQQRELKKQLEKQPGACDKCDKHFPNQPKLMKHISTCHSAKDKVCHLCGKAYRLNSMLKIHMERVHSKEIDFEVFVCDFCGKKCSGRTQITNHFKKLHTLRECKICDKRWWKHQPWVRHRRAYHQTEQYPCTDCNKVFSTRVYLNQHRKTHEGRYPCPVCPINFSFTTTLKTHIVSKHPEIKMPPSGTVLRNFDWNKYLKNFS